MANLNPLPKTAKHGRELVQRTRACILNAMDVLEKRGKPLSELAADAAEKEPLKFLDMAAKHMPKEASLEIMHISQANRLTDDELADIIAERARQKHDALEGECKEIKDLPVIEQKVSIK